MTSNTWFLIKMFLKSTSNINILKHSTDKAKRKFATTSLVGSLVLDLLLLVYSAMLSIGLAHLDQAHVIPELAAILLLGMPFVFTLLKSNGYLFGFKEYDMIMSMPFSVKSIVSGKFWYMYIKSIQMYGLLSLGMLIGYIYGGNYSLWSCAQWIIMTFALPIIPMVLATAIGAIVVKIGAGFKYKNIVQALLITLFLMPMFFGRFFIENTIRNDEMEDLILSISDNIDSSAAYIPIAKWFSSTVNNGDLLSFLLVLGSTVIIYEIFFILISKFYRQINSQLLVGSNRKNYELSEQKQMNMIKAVAFKEFKRMIGSSNYLLNVSIGHIIVFFMGIATLFVKPEMIITAVMQGAPIDASSIFPAIPVLFYFFLGMVPTTCCSPSLEGKNYWIMQTLPISQMDDNKGKILFNLYMSLPIATFSTIAASICFRVSIADAFFSLIAINSLCIYSSIFGLRNGLKHRRLDWENEIEVIKQGMAVSMYILPHIIIGIILIFITVVVNNMIHNTSLIMCALTLFIWILIFFAWKGVKKYSR